MERGGLYIIALLSILLSALYACSSRPKAQNEEEKDKKTITIAVTKKPTYPDMITYAIKPILEKKGYTLKLQELDESQLSINALIDGEIDMIIAGHEAAYNFMYKRTGWKVATLIKVPSAHMGIFSTNLKARNIEELKKELKKGDVVAMPDDPSNLPRSLILLENLGFLKLKEGIDKMEAIEKDIVENYYGLDFKVLSAVQIPRNLGNIAFGVIFGDDADLLGILDSAIIREVNMDERFLILFGVKPENVDTPWAKDFVEAVQSEEFKNVIEDPQYRFHKFYRPGWYIDKWGIKN
ncbi:D-methionine-binding lipoprotein MetQ [termite gut metagenome]|uniref:D-methionine-binding lipoprotein MetQ n=1 Tax=termite gut metagenome TaxID=433724 RepID=A0A5J4RIB3_9ZZZZ